MKLFGRGGLIDFSIDEETEEVLDHLAITFQVTRGRKQEVIDYYAAEYGADSEVVQDVTEYVQEIEAKEAGKSLWSRLFG